jgi:hypothetical protein
MHAPFLNDRLIGPARRTNVAFARAGILAGTDAHLAGVAEHGFAPVPEKFNTFNTFNTFDPFIRTPGPRWQNSQIGRFFVEAHPMEEERGTRVLGSDEGFALGTTRSGHFLITPKGAWIR